MTTSIIAHRAAASAETTPPAPVMHRHTIILSIPRAGTQVC
jgi:hypothetical protein